eukprot:m.158529 g.158529  ORF g.158529 m.158529 type:complete len:1589 (+) comp10248_c0_seq3:1693-6459(+)
MCCRWNSWVCRAGSLSLVGTLCLPCRCWRVSQRPWVCTLCRRSFFAESTLSGLVQLVKRAQKHPLPPDLPQAKPSQPRPSTMDKFPASAAQNRMWMLEQLDLEEELAGHNVIAVLELHDMTSEDIDRLAHCVKQLVSRHDILRTCYAMDSSGTLLQLVKPPQSESVSSIWHVEDASVWDSKMLADALTSEVHRRFDLAEGPVCRFRAFRRAGDEVVLSMCIHHIAVDGLSMGILEQELSKLFQGQQLPARASFQYGDFVQWEQSHQGDLSVLESDEVYWSDMLDSTEHLLSSQPAQRSNTPTSTGGFQHQFVFTLNQSQAIFAGAARLKVSPVTYLLGAFQVALLRCFQESPGFNIGFPIATRDDVRFHGIVGPLINTFVLPCRRERLKVASLAQLLQLTQNSLWNGMASTTIPFEALQRRLGDSRLFDVFFAFDYETVPASQVFPKHSAKWIDVRMQTSRFPLSLWNEVVNGAIRGVFEFDLQFFSETTITTLSEEWFRVIAEFGSLEESLDASCHVLVNQAQPITEEQKNQIMAWNNTARAFPNAKSIVDLISEAADSRTDAIAIIDGPRSTTYGALLSAAHAVRALVEATCGSARSLSQRQRWQQPLIGLVMERSSAAIASILGVLLAGAAYVPIDPSLTREKQLELMNQAGVSGYLQVRNASSSAEEQDNSQNTTPPILGDGGAWLRVFYTSHDECCSEEVGERPADLAYVLFTSGSTGRPKGVMVSNAMLSNLVHVLLKEDAMSNDDVCAQQSSLTFDAHVLEIFPALAAGSSILIISDEVKHEPSQLLLHWKMRSVSVAFCPAVMLNVILGYPSLLARLCDIPSLRLVNTGGSKLNDFAFHAHKFTFDIIDNYGLTEACVLSTRSNLSKSKHVPAATSVGHCIANHCVFIVGADGALKSVGAVGQVVLAPTVVLGEQFNRQLDGSRANSSIPLPNGMEGFGTGDLGRILPSTGELQILGRISNTMIAGTRVDVLAAEMAVRALPSVLDAVAFIHDDALLIALSPVLANTDTNREARDVVQQELLNKNFPILVGSFTTFPLTQHGKLDRSEVRKMILQQNKASTTSPCATPADNDAIRLDIVPGTLQSAGIGPPENTLERLRSIWRATLMLDEDFEIDSSQQFSSLGGNSIQLIQVQQHIHSEFDVMLSIKQLQAAKSLSAIARAVAAGPNSQVESPANADESMDLWLTDIEQVLSCAKEQVCSIVSQDADEISAHSLPSKSKILLTGATGFFGAHVLKELVERGHIVTCLVRASKDCQQQATTRLHASLDQYCLKIDRSKISVVVGDVSKVAFGMQQSDYLRLANSCDAVVHSAASVNFCGSTNHLFASNVMGSLSVIAFACKSRRKFVCFVGTGSDVAFFPPPLEVEPATRLTEKSPYTLSKLLSEKIMGFAAERGLAVSVVRPCLLTPSLATGRSNPNDLLCMVLKASLCIQASPFFTGKGVDMIPVDVAARLSVSFWTRANASNQALDLSLPDVSPIRPIDVLHFITGKTFAQIEIEAWCDKLVAALLHDNERYCTQPELLRPALVLSEDIFNVSVAQPCRLVSELLREEQLNHLERRDVLRSFHCDFLSMSFLSSASP